MSPVAQYVAQVAGAVVPRWLLWLLVFAVGMAAGAQLVAWAKDAELAQVYRAHAEYREKAEREARAALQAAQDRGDALTHELIAANAVAANLQQELDHAISEVTSGRPCLGADALRLLDSAPGIAAPGVPRATGRAAAADARNAAAATPHRAETADEPAATDTDVARWINAAGGQYAECARRLDALIDWHSPSPTTWP